MCKCMCTVCQDSGHNYFQPKQAYATDGAFEEQFKDKFAFFKKVLFEPPNFVPKS